MEGVEVVSDQPAICFGGAYDAATVLVTGHTGFKGSWMCEWLLALGARVSGLALKPETEPALFAQLGLASRVSHRLGDIRSADTVREVICDTQPDFLFHLAAQPLVRRSYREPDATWETNVQGTIHVLQALRELKKPCAVVIITTDKCYENLEWEFGYRESDSLGGHDPYSASKAAVELAVASWRRSFFGPSHPVRIATARAGNVIGGGDWSEDRIVPDAVHALAAGKTISVRNPHATRPWQHVLEPTSGYLAIAAALAHRPRDGRLEAAFNIGPDHDANQTVKAVVEAVLSHWPGEWTHDGPTEDVHEASLLKLDNSRIRASIGWRPTWRFTEAVEKTILWYRDAYEAGDNTTRERTIQDIRAYVAAAREQCIPWAGGASKSLSGMNNV